MTTIRNYLERGKVCPSVNALVKFIRAWNWKPPFVIFHAADAQAALDLARLAEVPGKTAVLIPSPPEGYELCDSVSDADAWGEEINGTRALGVMFFARNPDYKEMTEEELRREEMLTEGGWYRGKDGPDSVNS